MNILKITPKTAALTAFLTFTPLTATVCNNLSNSKPDTFEHSQKFLPPACGSRKAEILNNAPSPVITVAGKKEKAVIVVDLSKNVLYKYDSEGKPEAAYRIASGQKPTGRWKGTPTAKGLRKITHTEDAPYKYAYGTKRKRNPGNYGPHIILLTTIDPVTGKNLGSNGEFIHGNVGDKKNIEYVENGEYVSGGCMRMDNNVITRLYKQVKPGQYVLIK